MQSEINRIASEILAQEPGPVVHYRVLRDVLGSEPDDPRFLQANQDLEHSFWIKGLAAEQWEDGSSGAIHSRNTRRTQKILTNEMGVERARNIGLDASHPVLQNASEYIRNIIRGVLPFPDRHEKNDRWSTDKRLFLASTLSLIHPQDLLLNVDRDLWFEIADKMFQSGQHSQEDESNAHASLTGATVKDSYLVLSGKYQLNILGMLHGTLPQKIERSLTG